MKGKRIVSGVFVIAIYILFAVLLFCAINKKMNFHVDEIYSYGLANHTADGEKNMSIENGIKYIPADFPWQQYTTVSYDNRFNYKSVFENQKVDTHPPLYYCVLHTICSFFPERFSKWYAGIVNIFFMLLSLMAYRKILDLYFNNIFSKNILSVIFVITPAFINETMFLRMYPMAMYIVLMTMYAFVKLIRGYSNRAGLIGKFNDTYTNAHGLYRCIENNYVLVLIYFLTVIGTLTHYYCMLWIVILSVIFCVNCLLKKQILVIIKYCITMAASAITCIMIFPHMIYHLFLGNRGTEAMENATGVATFYKNIYPMVAKLSKEFTGVNYLLIVSALIISCVFIVFLIDNKRIATSSARKTDAYSVEYIKENLFFIYAIVLYSFVVAALAPYSNTRYYYPIYGVIFSTMTISYILLIEILRCKAKIFAKVIAILFAVFMTLSAWKNFEWDYVYDETAGTLAFAKRHNGSQCMIVHAARYKMHSCFYEVQNYGSTIFANHNNIDKLPCEDDLDGNSFVLIINGVKVDDTAESDGSGTDILEEVKSRYPNYKCVDEIFSGSYWSYYFEK